jgi:DNA (cytosine-5)-methyltransferase 1
MEETLGSAFRLMLSELADTGYYVVFDVLNAADYGSPQVRHRLIVLGSRDGELLSMPPVSHGPSPTKGLRRWRTLRDALRDLSDPTPEFEAINGKRAELLASIPPGGNWKSLPESEQRTAIGSAFDSWGGRSGFLRRLDWDRPAPAVTSRPSSKATFMCHPDHTRPLTVAECARLQQFPVDWQFQGSLMQKYAQIGNAVPVGLGMALGRHLRQLSADTLRRSDLCGHVACGSQVTLDRMNSRPQTILNPRRMRGDPDSDAAKRWLAEQTGTPLALDIGVAVIPGEIGRLRERTAKAV